MDNTLTQADYDALRSLHNRGFAVAVFNPDELNGAPADVVEDLMVERGWEAIAQLEENDDD